MKSTTIASIFALISCVLPKPIRSIRHRRPTPAPSRRRTENKKRIPLVMTGQGEYRRLYYGE